VLQTLNAPPGDLTPVFDAILDKAHALCGVEQGALVTYDGEYFRLAADRGMPQFWVKQFRAALSRRPRFSGRLDADLLEWFRRERGYQTRINAILRAYMNAQTNHS
jgi:hypothetical protein